MIVGIDASRAFQEERTGIEEYSYQVIKYLRNKLDGHRVVLYITKYEMYEIRKNKKVSLPENWKSRVINWPFFWTQIGLSLEMLFHPVDALFVPSHTVPLIHPQNTIVTIHGLEFETCPRAYSFWARQYMRFFVRKSCRWAQKIIAVSKNTKNDLVNLYKIPAEKIEVIYEGGPADKFQILNSKFQTNSKFKILNSKFILFIGRIEERKNIIGILRAFEILKEHYKIPHQLILAGKPGYGYREIINEAKNINFTKDVIFSGFVGEDEKQALLEKADLFLFPTFYEGFGLPVIEAQSAGVPVVAADNSSLKEIAGESASLVDPRNAEAIADAAYKILSDDNLKNKLIKSGRENAQRFSWEKCAREIAGIMKSN